MKLKIESVDLSIYAYKLTKKVYLKRTVHFALLLRRQLISLLQLTKLTELFDTLLDPSSKFVDWCNHLVALLVLEHKTPASQLREDSLR